MQTEHPWPRFVKVYARTIRDAVRNRMNNLRVTRRPGGRLYSPTEIADVTGLSTSDVRYLRDCARQYPSVSHMAGPGAFLHVVSSR